MRFIRVPHLIFSQDGNCVIFQRPPDNPSRKCAYLMNIYVREAFSREWIALKIVSRLVDEAKKRGCGKIYLETTAEGRPVYKSLGFREMADMMKYYDTENQNWRIELPVQQPVAKG
ncbi:MAG: GNAT family N-acetyltransferase [Muribaculaceae bacterium]|nr:GNAT family N-acetyltransferase [Muribaculaceae bacterium]